MKRILIFLILLIIILCFCIALTNLYAQIDQLNKKVTYIENQIKSPAQIIDSKSDLSFIPSLVGVVVTLLTFFILQKNSRIIQKKQDQTERISMQPFIMAIPINSQIKATEAIYGNGTISEKLINHDIVDLIGEYDNPQVRFANLAERRYSIVIGLKNVGKDVAVNTHFYLSMFGTLENGISHNNRYRINSPLKYYISKYLTTSGIFALEINLDLNDEIQTLTFTIEYEDKTLKRKYSSNIVFLRQEDAIQTVELPSPIRMYEWENNQWKEKIR